MSTTLTGTPAVDQPRGRYSWHSPVPWWKRPAWLACSAVAVLAAMLIGLHIHADVPLSSDGEPQHIDYVYRLLDGEVPVSGDRWAPATAHAASCRSIDLPGWVTPPCGTADLTAAPNQGLTAAFHNTPVYYLGPAAAVLLGHALGLPADDITLMRATGIPWFLAALWLLWLLWRDFEVPWQNRVGLSLALAAAPVVLLAQATVTNDASALAAGAAVTLTTLRWDRGRVGLWLPAAVAVLALLLKATSLAVILAACAYVLIRVLQRKSSARERLREALSRRTLLFVGTFAVAAGGVGIGWSAIYHSRATLDEHLLPQNINMTVHEFRPEWLASATSALLSPLQPDFYQSVLSQSASPVIVANGVNAGLLILAIIGAARAQAGSPVRALAAAVGVAALAFGPLFTIMQYLGSGMHFVITPGYGFSLVPAALAVAGTAVRSRRGGWVLLGVGVVFYLLIARRLYLA